MGALVDQGWFLTLSWESENLGRALPRPCVPMSHVICKNTSPSLAPGSPSVEKRREDGTLGFKDVAARLLSKYVRCGLQWSRGHPISALPAVAPWEGGHTFQQKTEMEIFVLNLPVLKCWLLSQADRP